MFIIDLLKGIAIGIANVIPGFSGGTMAVILKCYERIINALNDFVRHPLKVLKDVWALLVGMIFGIIIASFTIIILVNKFPFQTILFFVGLIIGSIPTIYENIDKVENTKYNTLVGIIMMISCIIIMVILPLLNSNTSVSEVNPLTLVVILIMGLISAGAMIIPGISGSLVLMVFGYYILIVGNIKSFLENIVHLSFNGILDSFLVLLFFGIGCVLGLIFISKLIKLLINKYPKVVYFSILGLLIGSIFSILYKTCIDYQEVISFNNPWIYIVGFTTFLIGASLAYLMSNYKKK